MCGIIGYVGRKEAEPILVEGLRRLEYRGYDSAGLATVTGAELHVRKRSGRIADLADFLQHRPAPGCHGISHTRWATHGPATDGNAHPHIGGDNLVAVVHNGVIENYSELRARLRTEGVDFQSDTDTEVIAQLIAHYLNGDLVEAVRKALPLLKGTYGLAVLSPRNPDVIVGARLGSPLVLGIGHNENFLASDPSALVGNTERVVYLKDNQLCVLTPSDWQIQDADRTRVEADVHPEDGRGEPLEAGHGALVVPDGQVPRVRLLVHLRLDHHVALGAGAAREGHPLLALEVHEREGGDGAVVHLAPGDAHLARPAEPVAAGVRQVHAAPQGGVEERLPLLDLDRLPQGLDGELVAHGLP